MQVDLNDPTYAMVDVIAESKDVLDHVCAMADGSLFIVNYIVDVVDTLFVYESKNWTVVKVRLKIGRIQVFILLTPSKSGFCIDFNRVLSGSIRMGFCNSETKTMGFFAEVGNWDLCCERNCSQRHSLRIVF